MSHMTESFTLLSSADAQHGTHREQISLHLSLLWIQCRDTVICISLTIILTSHKLGFVRAISCFGQRSCSASFTVKLISGVWSARLYLSSLCWGHQPEPVVSFSAFTNNWPLLLFKGWFIQITKNNIFSHSQPQSILPCSYFWYSFPMFWDILLWDFFFKGCLWHSYL